MKTVAALSLLASASAFAPAQTGSRVRHSLSNNFQEKVFRFHAGRVRGYDPVADGTVVGMFWKLHWKHTMKKFDCTWHCGKSKG